MAGNKSEAVNLGEALATDGGISTQCSSVYVPDKDQQGNEIGNHRRWVLEALDLLREINGGATAMPPCEGVWLNDDGITIWEHPVSYPAT
jgi:hypothetical protein